SSLLPSNLVSQYNAARNCKSRSAVEGHLYFSDVALERDIHGGLTAGVGLSEGDDRSIRHRVATAVTHGISLQLELLPRLLCPHLQCAGVARNLADDSLACDLANSSLKF